jgi:hypothetical protein
VKEEEELEKIEELELSGAEAEEARPLSIEEKAIGEEDEWRRRFKEKEEAPPEGEESKEKRDRPRKPDGVKEVPP